MRRDEVKWVSQCLKKARYRTEGFAEHIARDIKRERGVDLKVYYCNFCNGFHLSSKLDKEDKIGQT